MASLMAYLTARNTVDAPAVEIYRALVGTGGVNIVSSCGIQGLFSTPSGLKARDR
jgi:hypothetical protein